jgi:hypothetical protein
MKSDKGETAMRRRSAQYYQDVNQQMGYYYPQQMQGYYPPSAPASQNQYPPQYYGNQGYVQPYSPPAPIPSQQAAFHNPYPIPRPNQPQPTQFQSIMSQFKKTNGPFDFNKMMDTTGQVMSAMNQVGSLLKGFTSFFKG